MLKKSVYCRKENVIFAYFLSTFNVFYLAGAGFDLLLNLTFFLIQLMAVWNIVLDRSELNFSMNMMHWIFVLIHYFYAPISQISSNNFPWKSHFTTSQLLNTNGIVIIWCMCYTAVYTLALQNNSEWIITNGYKDFGKEKSPNNKSTQIMFYLSVLITLFSIVKFGSSLISSREMFDAALSSSGQIFTLVFKTMFRAFTVASLALLIWRDSIIRSRGYSICTYILFGCVLILYFPTNSGRLWILAIYMGLVFTIRFKMKHKYTLFALMIFGVFYFAAVINVFRLATNGLTDFYDAMANGLNIQNRLSNGDFDCYTMIARSLSYIGVKGIQWGKQLLGVFLFWVPRTFWPAKPVGSGSTVLAYQGSDFTNVSCPIIAEGYLNFGIIGVVTFAFLYALISKSVDSKACEFRNRGGYNPKSFGDNVQFVYGILVGYSYLLLRGDLLTAFSNLVGILSPVVVLTIINRFNIGKGRQ